MNKYIRTIDGKIVKINLEGNVFTSRYEIVGEPKDTIEELCDEFVVWQKDYEYETPITMPLKDKDRYFGMKTIIQLGLLGGITCWLKLAIWTNKGLIYVAKMNEKGEFELI